MKDYTIKKNEIIQVTHKYTTDPEVYFLAPDRDYKSIEIEEIIYFIDLFYGYLPETLFSDTITEGEVSQILINVFGFIRVPYKAHYIFDIYEIGEGKPIYKGGYQMYKGKEVGIEICNLKLNSLPTPKEEINFLLNQFLQYFSTGLKFKNVWIPFWKEECNLEIFEKDILESYKEIVYSFKFKNDNTEPICFITNEPKEKLDIFISIIKFYLDSYSDNYRLTEALLIEILSHYISLKVIEYNIDYLDSLMDLNSISKKYESICKEVDNNMVNNEFSDVKYLENFRSDYLVDSFLESVGIRPL